MEIWIPGSAREVVDRCKVPTPDGPCGHPFYVGESDRKKVEHLRSCAEANLERIREVRQEQHPDVLKPWDPEYAGWLEDNAAGIATGSVRW